MLQQYFDKQTADIGLLELTNKVGGHDPSKKRKKRNDERERSH